MNGHLLRPGLRACRFPGSTPFLSLHLHPSPRPGLRWPPQVSGRGPGLGPLGAPATLGDSPSLATWKMEVSFCREPGFTASSSWHHTPNTCTDTH